uniref:Uncharacterized protein n=1 Tax=viral metagenome TaxID=1070528 RepID=A0A6C0EAD3_9ZZZZ
MITKTLYVIVLENEKWVLHMSKQTEPEKIFMECKLLYSFTKNNNPLSIHESINITSELEIDMYVKKYMSFYGIENVRGGSYSTEVLDDHLHRTLYHELGYSFPIIETELDIIENIMNKCECFPKLPKSDIDKLKNHVEEKLNDYYKTKRDYESVKSYCVDDNLVEIDRTFIDDLNWISNVSALSYDVPAYKIKQDIYTNYQRILKKMNAIYNIFLKLKDDLSFEPIIYLQKPYVCLDNYVYHFKNKNTVNDNDKMKELLSVYEYMFYFVLNRKEELEFDLSTFTTKYIKELNYMLEYINMIQ